MRGELRLLRAAALVEAASLLVLLGNLATVHWAPVASATGPIHGCAYLLTIAATCTTPTPTRAKLLALIPAVGGLLALRETGRSPAT